MDSRLLVAAAVLTCGALGWTQLEELQGRLDRLEQAPRVAPSAIGGLAERLERIQGDLAASRDLLDELHREGEADVELVALAEHIQRDLAGHQAELRRWREESTQAVGAALEERLACLDEEMAAEWTRLAVDVEAAARLAEVNRGGLEELRGDRGPDPDRRWRELMGPTVQLAGESTVGSGVLLASRHDETGGWRTEVLTAWHVVRDILPELRGTDRPVPVRIYRPDGSYVEEGATLVDHDPEIDVALLVLDSDERHELGARLAPRARLERVRTFDRVYAVGCPLGNDPIPTAGEIAETHHVIDGERYWMISAPTYIGNSGGGVFDAETNELLGIFSKIYTHGSLRPTVVPHMGLAVPLLQVYDWLDSRGLAGVEPQPGTGRAQIASAQRRIGSAQEE
jgi:S1-C subfamily serine protease